MGVVTSSHSITVVVVEDSCINWEICLKVWVNMVVEVNMVGITNTAVMESMAIKRSIIDETEEKCIRRGFLN